MSVPHQSQQTHQTKSQLPLMACSLRMADANRNIGHLKGDSQAKTADQQKDTQEETIELASNETNNDFNSPNRQMQPFEQPSRSQNSHGLIRDIITQLDQTTRDRLLSTYSESLGDPTQMASLAQIFLSEMIYQSADPLKSCKEQSISGAVSPVSRNQTNYNKKFYESADIKHANIYEQSPFTSPNKNSLGPNVSRQKISHQQIKDPSKQSSRRQTSKSHLSKLIVSGCVKLTLEDIEKRRSNASRDPHEEEDRAPAIIKKVLTMMIQEEALLSDLALSLQRNSIEEALRLVQRFLKTPPLADYQIPLLSPGVQRQASLVQILLTVAAHFLLLNKQDLLFGHSQLPNKFRNVINNFMQSFLLIAEQLLSNEQVLLYSTNNPEYITLKKVVSTKLVATQKQSAALQLKSNNEANVLTLKKLLRSTLLNGVSYIQAMLHVLENTSSVSLTDIQQKLAVEKERLDKKNQEKKVQQNYSALAANNRRSLTPKTGMPLQPQSKHQLSFALRDQAQMKNAMYQRSTSTLQSRSPYELHYQASHNKTIRPGTSTSKLFETIQRQKADKYARHNQSLKRKSNSPSRQALQSPVLLPDKDHFSINQGFMTHRGDASQKHGLLDKGITPNNTSKETITTLSRTLIEPKMNSSINKKSQHKSKASLSKQVQVKSPSLKKIPNQAQQSLPQSISKRLSKNFSTLDHSRVNKTLAYTQSQSSLAKGAKSKPSAHIKQRPQQMCPQHSVNQSLKQSKSQSFLSPNQRLPKHNQVSKQQSPVVAAKITPNDKSVLQTQIKKEICLFDELSGNVSKVPSPKKMISPKKANKPLARGKAPEKRGQLLQQKQYPIAISLAQQRKVKEPNPSKELIVFDLKTEDTSSQQHQAAKTSQQMNSLLQEPRVSTQSFQLLDETNKTKLPSKQQRQTPTKHSVREAGTEHLLVSETLQETMNEESSKKKLPNEENQYNQSLENTENDIEVNDTEEFPQPTPPFLPEIREGREYTLVLDLDETLIHYDIDEQENEGYYLIRPGALQFLYQMSQLFEVVIFTAATPEYANWIIDSIDPQRFVTHRLFRQHTTPVQDYAIKDISKLGRPLSKTIIIDNMENNFIHTSPYNGIKVESWFEDMDDRVLENLIPFLKSVAKQRVEDVRDLFKNFGNIVEECINEGTSIPDLRQLTDQQDL